jgi:hypothetical protein
LKVIKEKYRIRNKGKKLTESKELEGFVRSACIGIRKGITEGLEIKFPIEFEVAVVIQKGVGGELKLFVVNASGNYAEQEISKIKFKIGKQDEASSGKIRFFRE